MNDYDLSLYPQVTGLKQTNPGLKVFISVGGWDAGSQVFSQMASSATNRAAFIGSALSFINTYAFDGLDLDWEYPVASDRGGAPADFANIVTLMAELQAALKAQGFGLSMTLPSSYWYLQNFDVANLQRHTDWFNVMTYDIHGTWDGTNP
jgi:chitinase